MSNATVINATHNSGQTAGSPITIEAGGDVVLKAFGKGTGAWSVTMAFAPSTSESPVTLTISNVSPSARTSVVSTGATSWVGWVQSFSGEFEASGVVEGYQPDEALAGDLGVFVAGKAPTKAVKPGATYRDTAGTSYSYTPGGGWVVSGSRIAKLKKLTNQWPVLPVAIEVMPTLTTSANGAATQIPSGVVVDKQDSAISYSSDMRIAGGAYPDYTAIRGFAVNYGTGKQANLTRAAFYYDGLELEIQIIGAGDTSFRLYVDGQIANEAASVTADGGFYRHKITFAAVGKRLIEWEFNSATKIVEFRRTPTGNVWKAPQKTRVIFTGDSFTEGPSGAFPQTSKQWSALCGRILGWDDTWLSGVGSTGYVAAPGGKLALKDRISTDIAPYNPDAVVVAMGINDSDALTEATVYATINGIRNAIADDAPIFVFGAWNPKSIPMATRNAVIKAATIRVPLAFYVDESFFTGTGRQGATTGNGNSDLYVFTDNTHPTQSGAEYLALRAATGIAAICADL